MKMITRKAINDDIEEIIALWREFMKELENLDYSKVEKNWSDRLRVQIERSKVVVAQNGNSLIGFVGFIDHDDREWIPKNIAYVVDIYVAPEARASIAARSLFNAVGRMLARLSDLGTHFAFIPSRA